VFDQQRTDLDDERPRLFAPELCKGIRQFVGSGDLAHASDKGIFDERVRVRALK
jgi:hypothetical protein